MTRMFARIFYNNIIPSGLSISFDDFIGLNSVLPKYDDEICLLSLFDKEPKPPGGIVWTYEVTIKPKKGRKPILFIGVLTSGNGYGLIQYTPVLGEHVGLRGLPSI